MGFWIAAFVLYVIFLAVLIWPRLEDEDRGPRSPIL